MNHMDLFKIGKYVINDVKIGDKITLIPFSDIHRDAHNCHVEKWLEDVNSWRRRVESGERLYFIGVGDYTDLYSASERKAIQNADLHDSSIWTREKQVDQSIDNLYQEMNFMKGRCVGLIEGNHHFVFSSDNTTSTQRLCRKLECVYLGGCAMIRLIFRDGRRGIQKDLFLHHGTGGGGTTASSVNNLEKAQQGFHADIYIMGHDHKKWGDKVDQLALSQSRKSVRLINQEKLFARSGSYLRGYVPNQASYVTRKAMRPSNLGGVEIEMTKVRSHAVDGETADRLDLKTRVIL